MFFIVFLLIAFYPLINNEEVKIWSLITSSGFLILVIFNSKILNPLNKIWFIIGIFLVKIVPLFIIGLLFFCCYTYWYYNENFKKDLLNLKSNNYKSY